MVYFIIPMDQVDQVIVNFLTHVEKEEKEYKELNQWIVEEQVVEHVVE